MTRLPSAEAGETTETVGWFEHDADALAAWLASVIDRSTVRRPGWTSLEEAAAVLRATPVDRRFRRACVPVGDTWTVLLTSGPTGTDVGLLPSGAASALGCRALRATCVEDGGPGYPARVLELFGPDGAPPLLAVRSIAAANDGGRWVFETFGEPLAFEDQDAYGARLKRDRLTGELLHTYLRELGVPVGVEPDWPRAQLVETDEGQGARAALRRYGEALRTAIRIRRTPSAHA